MRKYVLILLILLLMLAQDAQAASFQEGLNLLTLRKDKQAAEVFEAILVAQPDNLDALWGRAEVLRRQRKINQAEDILQQVLSKNPKQANALISLAYIRYQEDKFNEAQGLIKRALAQKKITKEEQALVYTMLGGINGMRAKKSGLLNKVIYGTRVKGYFLKAKQLAPQLPEVHQGLGTFYLLAPAIGGGNINQAIKELELAVKLCPDFATANARLAQAYKKAGNLEKYNHYLEKAKAQDPENEVLKEMEKEK